MKDSNEKLADNTGRYDILKSEMGQIADLMRMPGWNIIMTKLDQEMRNYYQRLRHSGQAQHDMHVGYLNGLDFIPNLIKWYEKEIKKINVSDK